MFLKENYLKNRHFSHLCLSFLFTKIKSDFEHQENRQQKTGYFTFYSKNRSIIYEIYAI